MRGSVVKKPNGRYYVVTRERHGSGWRQRSHGGYGKKGEAEAALAVILGRLQQGPMVEPSQMLLADYIREAWLPQKQHDLRTSTYDSYTRLMDWHVLPRLGSLRLRDLRATHLNTLYSQLLATGRRNGKGGLAPKTVRYVHTTLHKALADAVDADLIHVNPAVKAKAPKVKTNAATGMHCWTADDVRTFLAYVSADRLSAVWTLAAHTGMRRGEILGLRWTDVDLDAGRLSVRQAVTSVNYKIVISPTKTSTGTRTVDLDSGTVASLRAHRVAQLQERLAAGPQHVDHDLVAARENGEPIHPDRFTQLFDLHVKRSGLPRIRLHDLRHTHASILLASGVPVKVVSERLGHASVAFTMQQYQHVLPGMQAAAATTFATLVAEADREAAQ